MDATATLRLGYLGASALVHSTRPSTASPQWLI